VIRAEALRLGSPRSTATRRSRCGGGLDGSVVRMVKQFDAERQRSMPSSSGNSTLSHEALHDALTGPPQSQVVFDRLGRALARSTRHDFGTAVRSSMSTTSKAVNDNYDIGPAISFSPDCPAA